MEPTSKTEPPPEPVSPTPRSAATVALVASAKSVGGGVVLTLLTIGLVELISGLWFKIPRPSSLYFLAVAAASLLGGMRSGLISALIVFAYSAVVTHEPGGHLFPFPVYTPEQTTRLMLFGLTTPAMAILVGLLRRRNDNLLKDAMRREAAAHRAAEQAERAAQAARQAQADLDRERRIAVTLQSALLSPLPAENAFAGVGIGYCYEAASNEAEVGGDFYDVIALDATTIAVVIGDVSGKGLKAAAKTAEVKFTLRTVLYDLLVPSTASAKTWPAAPVASAGQALTRVNQILAHEIRYSASATGAGIASALSTPVTMPVFVCLAVAILNTTTGEGALSVAGMEPPIVLRSRPEGIIGEIFTIGGLPIGVLPDAEYETAAFRLGAGETLLISTDGLTESRRRGNPSLFGIEGLCRAAEVALAEPATPTGDTTGDALSLNGRATQIVAAAKAFAGEETLKDDACVLLVQRH